MKNQRNKKKHYVPDDTDLIFIFKNVKMSVEVDFEMYSKTELKTIQNAVNILSKEIRIDKSYVECNEHKYKNTFLTLHGWNELCQMVFETDFGNDASNLLHDIMLEAYNLIIKNYVLMCLDDVGYDISGISVYIKDNSKFSVEYVDDISKPWKHYCGIWLDWPNQTGN